MSTIPAPAPASGAPDLGSVLQNGLKLNISGTLPGEALLTQIFAYASAVRGTMRKDLLDRLDAITVQQAEDLQALWRGIWVTIGVLPKA